MRNAGKQENGTEPEAAPLQACRGVPACKTMDTARRRGAPPSNTERRGFSRWRVARHASRFKKSSADGLSATCFCNA